MQSTIDYKGTLNLPQTDFLMRAALPEREPLQIEKWKKEEIYKKIQEKNRKLSGPIFILHDGPPYANGGIHIGHALNKILKDIIVKRKLMLGFQTQYIPGWDCHGLPIELGVEKQLSESQRDKRAVPLLELRKLCEEYAQKFVELQKKQFERLEVFADWEHSYLTMEPEYVAQVLRALGSCAEAGVLYRSNRPVHWCYSCQTALAEAELEYKEKNSPSIYVKFDLKEASIQNFKDLHLLVEREAASRVSLVIWTSTPWTLPANLALALHPEFIYVVIKVPSLEGTELWIVAEGRQAELEAKIGFEKKSQVLLRFQGQKLERQKAQHPFLERDSLIILSEFVTLDMGTGIVHTAPGHGMEDYELGKRYGLEILAPVDARARLDATCGAFSGLFVFKANLQIQKHLEDSGHLVLAEELRHSYPHCWRCLQPIIFRATPQWFIAMDEKIKGHIQTLRQFALEAVGQVEWVPKWGVNRLSAMLQVRPDWCISRQRAWGVPIPAFFCESCGTIKAEPKIFEQIAKKVEESGLSVWFSSTVEELLGGEMQCSQCSGVKFKKSGDTLDVWFESGSSHQAVLEKRGFSLPADLYLEGSDQHRGWFQTSLLISIASQSRPPFRAILTHGFVNDKNGKKMSKSRGNVVSPLDIVNTQGAEILRLWVTQEDYRNDLNFSHESLQRVSETYRKIRNTLRFILANLFDFQPDLHAVPFKQLGQLDHWALSRASDVLSQVEKAYESYEFHKIYHLISNFFGVDLSARYFDILKDRLYTSGKNAKERRSSQTALFWIGRSFIHALAPILSFTAEEAWALLAGFEKQEESVFLARSDKEFWQTWYDAKLEAEFEKLWAVRMQIFQVMEEARKEKKIGHSREVCLNLKVSPQLAKVFSGLKEELSRIFLVSAVELEVEARFESQVQLEVEVSKVDGEKCPRCWTYVSVLSKDSNYRDLCYRCVEALKSG